MGLGSSQVNSLAGVRRELRAQWSFELAFSQDENGKEQGWFLWMNNEYLSNPMLCGLWRIKSLVPISRKDRRPVAVIKAQSARLLQLFVSKGPASALEKVLCCIEYSDTDTLVFVCVSYKYLLFSEKGMSQSLILGTWYMIDVEEKHQTYKAKINSESYLNYFFKVWMMRQIAWLNLPESNYHAVGTAEVPLNAY